MKVTKKTLKENSNCPVSFCISKIGGKWKPIIISQIRKRTNRFGALQRTIQGISKQMLIQQLRELEKDNILKRIIHKEVPPKVEYIITEYGKSLFPIINAMTKWGNKNMEAVNL